jgi:hypothetical protein
MTNPSPEGPPLAAFLTEACELEPAAHVGAKDLYDHYREWAVRHGLSDKERLGSVIFGRKASERFKRSHTLGGRVYPRRREGHIEHSMKGCLLGNEGLEADCRFFL